MTTLNLDLLQNLCELPGVPGYEERVRSFIYKKVKHLCDSVETDPMGNLICRVNGITDNDETTMLACHMDEIGFIVNYIDEKGFIYCQPLGGFDPRNLFSRRVLVCTDNGDYSGVMNPAGLPIHLSKPEDRKNIPAADEFVIDIGMDANECIKIGDFIVMDEPFLEMGNKIVSKALDNRVACYLGIRVLENFNTFSRPATDLVVVFTTQEEVGLRGAKTAAFGINPTVGIGVDVTLSCDTPGVPRNKWTTEQGKGFALGIRDASFIGDKSLVKLVEEIAEENDIPYQRVVSAGGGMDGAALQQAGSGCAAVAISVGTRYIHTVTEMVDIRDLEAAEDALYTLIESL